MNPGSYQHEQCSRKPLIPYSFRVYQYFKIEVCTKVTPLFKYTHNWGSTHLWMGYGYILQHSSNRWRVLWNRAKIFPHWILLESHSVCHGKSLTNLGLSLKPILLCTCMWSESLHKLLSNPASTSNVRMPKYFNLTILPCYWEILNDILSTVGEALCLQVHKEYEQSMENK